MKKVWHVVLGLVILAIAYSYVAQAEEQKVTQKDNFFLAISFSDKSPNVKKYKFKEGIVNLDVDTLSESLEKVDEISHIYLYADGVGIERKSGVPWEEINKQVMLTLKEQFGYDGYVLFDGNKLTQAQIDGYLSNP